ncbi:hypothetical protein AGMMS50267_18110 [Spirochaetia bacterium]|nr:hypothetical protein AGMMS50267_18110 [Spirochaetia bacterium]
MTGEASGLETNAGELPITGIKAGRRSGPHRGFAAGCICASILHKFYINLLADYILPYYFQLRKQKQEENYDEKNNTDSTWCVRERKNK